MLSYLDVIISCIWKTNTEYIPLCIITIHININNYGVTFITITNIKWIVRWQPQISSSDESVSFHRCDSVKNVSFNDIAKSQKMSRPKQKDSRKTTLFYLTNESIVSVKGLSELRCAQSVTSIHDGQTDGRKSGRKANQQFQNLNTCICFILRGGLGCPYSEVNVTTFLDINTCSSSHRRYNFNKDKYTTSLWRKTLSRPPSLLLWSQMGKHPTCANENELQQSPCPSVLSPSCYR